MLPPSYPDLASCFSFQGCKKGANSHCLLIYFYFSFCALPGAAPVAGTVPHQLLLGFASAPLVGREKGFVRVDFALTWARSSGAAGIDVG